LGPGEHGARRVAGVTFMPLTAILQIFDCRSGNAMDIPANQRYVLCLFVWFGWGTHSDPCPPADVAAGELSATEIEADHSWEFSMCFQLFVDENERRWRVPKIPNPQGRTKEGFRPRMI
jgi:hypothetical protein